jgi:hypothetical protein
MLKEELKIEGTLSQPFDFGALRVCNSGDLKTTDPIRVVTPLEQWSYALMIPVRELTAEESTDPVAVRIDGIVRRGIIGIGLAAEDGASYLGEVEQAFIDEGHFELLLDSLSGCRWLVVRNALEMFPPTSQCFQHVRSEHVAEANRTGTASNRRPRQSCDQVGYTSR